MKKDCRRHRKQSVVTTGEKVGINWEFEINRYKVLYRKEINKVLLYSTGNYIQYPVINHNGKKMNKNIYTHTHTHTHIYIYITESLCCIPEAL